MRFGFSPAILLCAAASSAWAGPVLTLQDGPAPQVFANGSGSGFGGILGGGSVTMDATLNDLIVGLNPNGSLGSNIMVVYLDTRPGGFTDATMNDTADAGRNVVTNLTRDSIDLFPFEADFAMIRGSFGSVTFELTGGSLNFIGFDASGGPLAFNRAAIGNPSRVDFFAALVSDTNFMSNEVLPGPALAASNPGFGSSGSPVTFSNYNQFVIVPLPAAAWMGIALLGGVGLKALRSRRVA